MNFKDVYKEEMAKICAPEKLYKADVCFDALAGKKRQRTLGEVIKTRKIIMVAVLVLVLLAGGATVYAAIHLLSASDVAEKFHQTRLSRKFSAYSDVCITQENSLYRVSYLGEVSGKNLRKNKLEAEMEKTYFVLAVERKDETDISYEDEVEASPFIKGVAPYKFNIYDLGGSAESEIIDGVRYYLYDCENLEIFADYGVYLGVSDAVPDSDLYCFDEETGEITRNTDYAGLNLLFTLDIDRKKADTEKAEALLQQLKEEEAVISNQDVEEMEQKTGKEHEKDVSREKKNKAKGESDDEMFRTKEEWHLLSDQEKMKYVLEHGTLVEESLKTVEPDADGKYHYVWEGHMEVVVNADNLSVGEINFSYGIGQDGNMVYTRQLKEDKTITFAAYKIKDKKLLDILSK